MSRGRSRDPRGRRLLLWRRGTRKCEGAGLRDLTQVPAPVPPPLRTRPTGARPFEAPPTLSRGSSASQPLSVANPSVPRSVSCLGLLWRLACQWHAGHPISGDYVIEEDSEAKLGGTAHAMETGRHRRGFPNYLRPRPGLPTGQLARLAWPHSSSCWLEQRHGRAQCPPPGLPIPALPERRNCEVSRARGSSQSLSALLLSQLWELPLPPSSHPLSCAHGSELPSGQSGA